MIYEYKCGSCEQLWTLHRKVKDRDSPAKCDCGGNGKKQVSDNTDWYFHRTHPDVHQDMGEMVAGCTPNISEI